MAYFPMFVDLKDKTIVVIGGGNVAYRKILKLLQFDAKIILVAPKICAEIKELANEYSNLVLKNKEFEIDDIKNSFFVISAVNDAFINSQVAQSCKDLNIPVNSVDNLENCSFLFPALIKKDSLVIGILTSGRAPNISALIKNIVENNLPENISNVIETLGLLREELKNKVLSQECRAFIVHSLIEYCQMKDFKISYNELEEKMLLLIKENDNCQTDIK